MTSVLTRESRRESRHDSRNDDAGKSGRVSRRVNLLGAPGLIVVLIVTQVPFLVTIVLSMFNWNIRRPDIPVTFNGIENYVHIFSDGDFYTVLLNTFKITFFSLAIAMVLAFILALMFNRRFPGVAIARSLLIIPYFVMEPVIGIVWKTLMLSPSFGINEVIARFFGMDPISFFNADNALNTVIMLCVWQWTPFLFLILLSGLQSLPEDVLEAANVDGAGWFRQIWSFKIPLMKPYFQVAGVFGLINLLKVFGIIFVTTQGGPGVASANLPYYVYRTAFYDWQVGRSAAISVVMVLLTLVIINFFFRAQGEVVKK